MESFRRVKREHGGVVKREHWGFWLKRRRHKDTSFSYARWKNCEINAQHIVTI